MTYMVPSALSLEIHAETTIEPTRWPGGAQRLPCFSLLQPLSCCFPCNHFSDEENLGDLASEYISLFGQPSDKCMAEVSGEPI